MKQFLIVFVVMFFFLSCSNSTSKINDDQNTAGDSDEITETDDKTLADNEQSDIENESDVTDDSDNVNDLPEVSCKIPDTGQKYCFSTGPAIQCPSSGDEYFGQDAQYAGYKMEYKDNGDGTVTDLITGLMWTQTFAQTDFNDAPGDASAVKTGGYDDWRVPTIKELYSLMNFNGSTGSGSQDGLTVPTNANPFINTDFFDFEYGTLNRFIDVQIVTSTKYIGTVMNNEEAFFGLNVADGRIKGYPLTRTGGLYYYGYFVRGRTDYGENDFVDNGDETVTDKNTGLMWMKSDNGYYGVGDETYGGMFWADALKYCEDLDLAGYVDWRLPNAKELQYIVDYTNAPSVTGKPAIDPIFNTTEITVEDGSKNYPFFWTSTTHVEGNGQKAAYVAFGQAFGFMSFGSGDPTFMDVHGAGCQRSDTKTGDPADYPTGFGPQGDVLRFYNFVRCVRNGAEFTTDTADPSGFEQEMIDGWDESNGTEDPDSTEVPDNNNVGPTTCESDDDCKAEGTCPPEATSGCGCNETPMGEKICMPKCADDEDCPLDMNGGAMTCMDGFCVPSM